MLQGRCNSSQLLLVLCVLCATLLLTSSFYLTSSQIMYQAWITMRDYFHLQHAPLSAGCLSGCLHALTGADHLAALLPVIVTQRYFFASGYGLLWGLGHGCSSALVGYLGYAMKGLFLQTPASVMLNYRYLGDFIVAITVLVIGGMGVYENQHNASEEKAEENNCNEKLIHREPDQDLEASNDTAGVQVADDDHQRRWNIRKNLLILSSVFVNGVVLGVSWDGLPSLAPAMVLDDWQVTSFLIAYLVSTMLTMGFASAVIGELSFWIAYHSQINKLSDHLARVCSYAACVIGTGWLMLAVAKYSYAITHHEATNDNVFPGLANNDNVLEDMDSTGSAWLCIASISIVIVVIFYSITKDFHLQPGSSSCSLLSSTCHRSYHFMMRLLGMRPNKHVEEVL